MIAQNYARIDIEIGLNRQRTGEKIKLAILCACSPADRATAKVDTQFAGEDEIHDKCVFGFFDTIVNLQKLDQIGRVFIAGNIERVRQAERRMPGSGIDERVEPLTPTDAGSPGCRITISAAQSIERILQAGADNAWRAASPFIGCPGHRQLPAQGF